jgi:hypothetical protein
LGPKSQAILSANLVDAASGGLEQILALAGLFLGLERVLADDQALAGKLGGNLGRSRSSNSEKAPVSSRVGSAAL